MALSDYGTYVCTVKNKLGESKIPYELVIKSKPNSPTDLKIVNVTQNSITLSWTLEFDGGRYFELNFNVNDNTGDHFLVALVLLYFPIYMVRLQASHIERSVAKKS